MRLSCLVSFIHAFLRTVYDGASGRLCHVTHLTGRAAQNLAKGVLVKVREGGLSRILGSFLSLVPGPVAFMKALVESFASEQSGCLVWASRDFMGASRKTLRLSGRGTE